MLAIGCDHGGYKLKEEIKKYLDEKEIAYKDFGAYSEERTDYPIYAQKVAEAILAKECDKGILCAIYQKTRKSFHNRSTIGKGGEIMVKLAIAFFVGFLLGKLFQTDDSRLLEYEYDFDDEGETGNDNE